jgi:hypothetical protein
MTVVLVGQSRTCFCASGMYISLQLNTIDPKHIQKMDAALVRTVCGSFYAHVLCHSYFIRDGDATGDFFLSIAKVVGFTPDKDHKYPLII